MQLTAKGDLLLGLPYNGQLYYSVTVSALTMGAECEALEIIAELGLDDNTPERVKEMLIEFAYLAEQIEVNGIPKAVMTPQYLLENLTTDDYSLILELILSLRKKAYARFGEPKGGRGTKRPRLKTALANYRQAVMILAKLGFTAKDVWLMNTVEVMAWVESYLESQGIKPKADGEGTMVSARMPISELKKRYHSEQQGKQNEQ